MDDYARSSAQFAQLLDDNDLADFTVDNDDLTVPEVATAVLTAGCAIRLTR